MKLNIILKTIIAISFIIGVNNFKKQNTYIKQSSQIQKKVRVYNFDNKTELSEFSKLKLDKTHPNLLNPKISASDYKAVKTSWIDLHQRIGKYLSDKEFNWEVKDSTITILQKIYFSPNGEVENYFFKVQNKNVAKEKKEEFSNLITEFLSLNKIQFKKDQSFAQCGKTSYQNK